jgi:hypothetical protein
MTPIELMNTVYLGDRACKTITIDGWGRRLLLQVDCLSRIRDPSGLWKFYTDEDIEDALIVLTGVRSVALEPPGVIPDDYFVDWHVDSLTDGLYRFLFTIGGSGPMEQTGSANLVVVASGVHLEDPKRTGKEIVA